ncbi:hypothetical protein IQ224_10495 [Microcystis sp. LEGE 00066]|uniref:hypothetical protein n=1 Tax=Microcystis sp. LEGE 00066 TaxID=1828685 RepID=UPI0019F0F73B|nr:hypothetical protein [Microcystis sp. LEGE 00066]MBE9262616.1 hypothetical protein [Microcystis sp. LEGE 00066]
MINLIQSDFSINGNRIDQIINYYYSSYLKDEIGSFGFGESVVHTKLGYTSS